MSQKNYELSLQNFVRLHHRDNQEINEVSIHKIVISSSKLDIDILDNSKDSSSSQNVTKFDLKLENCKAERDFFNLLFLCQVFNQPQFFMEKLKIKDPNEMYFRAKGSSQQMQFYDFYEWIHKDISKVMYDRSVQMETGLKVKKKF